MRGIRIAATAVLIGSATSSLGAQDWRILDASRQLRDSGAHDVRVRYGAGRLQVRPSTDRVLYSMWLRYDENNGRPLNEYDAERRRLTVGLTDQSFRFAHNTRESSSDLSLAHSPSVPMNL